MELLIILAAKYVYLLNLVLVGWEWIKSRDKIRGQMAWVAAISLPLALLVAKGLSRFIYNPRPFVVEKIQPIIAHAADNGFPSDHTLLAATLAGLVTLFNKKLGGIMWGVTLIVAWGRVAARIHHPADVGASIIIAVAAVGIGKIISSWFSGR
jgi:undecaprenyl-diphosphatase